MVIKTENGRVVSPFSCGIDTRNGKMDDYDTHVQRYLGKLASMFSDPEAAETYLKKNGDVLIYEVYEKDIPEADGEIRFCSSITCPGKIGGEYFMTKGHFHSRPDTAELYYCTSGWGFMLMEKESGEYAIEEMYPGRAVYVPGYYAHRSINTGDQPLISIPVYPGDAGHDYSSIEKSGFRHIVIEKNGKPQVVENPRYGKMSG
ncbi:MAG: glucose-6-phosphate isomerase family protein [Spirochaetota bacterium]